MDELYGEVQDLLSRAEFEQEIKERSIEFDGLFSGIFFVRPKRRFMYCFLSEFIIIEEVGKPCLLATD